MEFLERVWPDVGSCTEDELVKILQYHMSSFHPSSMIESTLTESIRGKKLDFDKLMANWPTKETRLRERQKYFESDSLLEQMPSTPTILGTPTMQQFKHFLPFARLAFEVWLEKTANNCIPGSADDQFMVSVCSGVKEYIDMLMITIIDWLCPNVEQAADIIEDVNFWHFSTLIQMIYDSITDPSSSFVLQWCRWFELGQENSIYVRIDRFLTYLLQLTHPLANSLLFSSIESLAQACASLTRPCYLDEIDALGNRFRLDTSFYRVQFRRTSDQIILSDSNENQTQDDGFMAEADGEDSPKLDNSLSWLNLGSPAAARNLIKFILHETLIGTYLYHTPLVGVVNLLSNMRTIFNESNVAFVTSLMVSFLAIEKDYPKQSISWFKARCGMVHILPKLLQKLLSQENGLFPSAPPKYALSPNQILVMSVFRLIEQNEMMFTRVMMDENDVENGLKSSSFSILHDLLAALGYSNLLSHQNLQLLVDTNAREEIRLMLDDHQDWIFLLPPSDPSPPIIDSDISSLVQSLKSSIQLSDYLNSVQALTRLICDASPKIDQIALILSEFIISDELEQELICEPELNIHGDEITPIGPTFKLAVLLEYLCYSPVMEMLTMVTPVWEWLGICLKLLAKYAKANLQDPSSSASLFSSVMLFALHLISLSQVTSHPHSRQMFITCIQRFITNEGGDGISHLSDLPSPSSHNGTNQNLSLTNSTGIDDWQEFDDDLNQVSAPTSPIAQLISFFYSILIEDHKSVPNHSVIEKMVALFLNGASSAEVRSFSPLAWLTSIPHLMAMCINVLSIQGPNGEHHDIILPLLEGIHAVSSVLPCIRPLVLHWIANEYYLGAGDSFNVIHDSYISLMLPELSSRWILLSHGASQPEMTQFARVVCISYCKVKLAKIFETDPLDWTQNLYELVADPNYFDDSMVPSNDFQNMNNSSSTEPTTAIATKPTKMDQCLNFIATQMIDRIQEYDVSKNWSAVLTNLSRSEDAMMLLENWIKILNKEIDSAVQLTSTSFMNGEMSGPEHQTKNLSLSLRRVQMLAISLSNHLFPSLASLTTSTSVHSAQIMFLSLFLPAELHKMKSTTHAIFLAHFTYCVLASSRLVQLGIFYNDTSQQYMYAAAPPKKLAGDTTLSVADLELLQAIHQLFELVSGILKSRSRENIEIRGDSMQEGTFFELFAVTFLHLASCSFGLLSLFPSLFGSILEVLVESNHYSTAIQACLSQTANSSITQLHSPSLNSQLLTLWKILCAQHFRATDSHRRTDNESSLFSDELLPIDVISLSSTL